jgi:hypothetical protein
MNEQRYRKKVTQNQVKSVLETMTANIILIALLSLVASYSTIRRPAKAVHDIENEIPVMTSYSTSQPRVTRSPRPIYKGDKMDPSQLKKHIEYILIDMDMFSESAVDLLMLTCAQESHMGYYIEQIDGPARGIFQMEPGTHNFLWKYIDRKGDHFKSMKIDPFSIAPDFNGTRDQVLNIAYQIAMARINYWRYPDQIPAREKYDSKEVYIWALAEYWKKHWNTYKGKGTVKEAHDNYYRYVEGKA